MERVLNLLLIRFGLIAGGVVVLALLVFAVALALKRRGRLDAARRNAAPVAQAVSRCLDDRGAARGGGASRGGGSVAGSVVRAAARHLADGGRGQSRREREPGRGEAR